MESESAYHIKSLFLQGSYRACVATAESSAQGDQASQLYAARSHVALNDTDAAVELLATLDQEDPSVKACTLLAEQVGTGESVLDELRELLPLADQGVVRPVAGTILQLEGETAEAINLLADAGEDLESVALHIQILLSLHRVESARKVYKAASSWAEDSFLIQLCEAWIGLQTGGDAYQSAYYVFDEIAQLPSANNTVVLNGKAIAQACMGNWPEAEASLTEASSIDPDYPNTTANLLTSALPSGKALSTVGPLKEKLETLAPHHALLADLQAKSDLFDAAASKFATASA